MRSAIAALLTLLAVPAAYAGDPVRDLADAFVLALGSRDLVDVVALAETPDSTAAIRLLEETGRRSCVVVHGYRLGEITPTTVRMQIDATEVTSRRERALPADWVLEVVCDGQRCRLRHAETAERRAARLCLEALPPEGAQIEVPPNLDSRLFAQELAAQVIGVAVARSRTAGDEWSIPFRFALSTAQDTGDRTLESFVWSKAAQFAASRGHPEVGVQMARAGVAAAERSGDLDTLAAARFRLGICLWNLGSMAESSRWLESGASLVDQLEFPTEAIKSLYMASYVKRLDGKVRECLLDCERVVELAGRYDWPEGAAAALITIGELHLRTREYPLAVEDFRLAYRNAAQGPPPGHVAASLAGLGLAQLENGEAGAAAATLSAAERITETARGSSRVEIDIVLGGIFQRTGRLAEAEKHLQVALEAALRIPPWTAVADVSTELSRLRLAQKRPAEALAYAEQSIKAEQQQSESSIDWSPWPALVAKARALRALGRSDDALAALRYAVQAVEDQRQTAPGDALASARFFEDKVEPYLEMIDMLIDRGRVTAAFDYAERLKGRALQDVLERGDVDRRSMLTAPEKEEERTLAVQLAKLNKAALAAPGDAELRPQIAAARLALERFDTRMEMIHPQARISPTAHHETGRRFPADLGNGAVVEFVVTEHRMIVFAAWRGADGATRLTARSVRIDRRELERRVDRLEQQIAARDLQWPQTATSLYDVLLAPVESALAGHDAICVIPDGVLWRVPFPLLRHDGRALVERAAVFYAPSLSMLRMTARRRQPPARRGELLAFGNPSTPGTTRDRVRALTREAKLGSLPDAESEVRTIASLYGERQSRVYLRDAARESVFKREVSHYRILHFATHGILDDRSPMYSAIVLAAGRDESDDGLVEAREVLDLQVDADLAVLASCDTARGQFGAGEGLLGISWAFLVAGCPTTVVSQWQADSKATATLMVELYRHLHNGVPPAEALRRAQLSMRANPRYQDPLYWAPFIVVGAGMRTVR